MKVVIVGSGYVGLVSGACFSALGHSVVCVDSNEQKIETLKAGGVPIYEPGLGALIKTNMEQSRLAFSCDLEGALKGADFAFIAVGTPTRQGGSEADLTSVYSVASAIARTAEDGIVIVTKSTVPVGTGEALEGIVRAARPDLVFAVVSNPEFLKEGSAIEDFMKPDRVVVGCDLPWATEKMKALYEPLRAMGVTILHTGRNAAEVIKYAANAFLAIKISFINEIADFCEAVGADVSEVADGIGKDKRIGRAFLNPGPGYGGSCFPKDTLALLATAQSHAVNLRVVESSISANDARKRGMGNRVVRAFGQSVRGKTIALLGLTFKANTDDMREAPSLDIISSLQRLGARVRVYDPKGMEQARQYLRDVDYTADPYQCAAGADGVVVATEWKEFEHLDFVRLATLTKHAAIVDLRNILDVRKVEAAGFELHRIGTPPRKEKAAVQQQGPRRLAVKADYYDESTQPNAANGAVRAGAPLPVAIPAQ
ncbi:UDP-glucose dehydrogenase family protein [Rhizobium sp. Root708]|uniref:UDP-glucose dehydrogenase family protein n=1 Tax=Rhizobium sp. Root708 TaxID=1736592 RepID=UPI0009E7BDC6|nr:UDP-glucose/GDP-mannose dehydrogenase family protein [Rhizobium sp. Root708]